MDSTWDQESKFGDEGINSLCVACPGASSLGNEGFEVREERFDESGAAQGTGGLHVMNASGPSECGSNLVERFTELDGLEVLGFFVQSGFAEGVEESLDGVEERSPVDPLWESGRLRPGEEEAPFLMAQNGEVFFPANAHGPDVSGYG